MNEDARAGNGSAGRPIELWISSVLFLGVILASALLLSGLILFFAKGAGSAVSFNDLIHQENMSGRLGSILREVGRADANAVMKLGVLALILTPIARVGMSVLLFASERDRAFVLVTGVVLTVLLGGFIISAFA
jgi:uncharacterized membrane protein